MKQVVIEYAGAVIALLGTIGFFAIVDSIFIGREGVLEILILVILGGL